MRQSHCAQSARARQEGKTGQLRGTVDAAAGVRAVPGGPKRTEKVRRKRELREGTARVHFTWSYCTQPQSVSRLEGACGILQQYQ